MGHLLVVGTLQNLFLFLLQLTGSTGRCISVFVLSSKCCSFIHPLFPWKDLDKV